MTLADVPVGGEFALEGAVFRKIGKPCVRVVCVRGNERGTSAPRLLGSGVIAEKGRECWFSAGMAVEEAEPEPDFSPDDMTDTDREFLRGEAF